MFDRLLLWSVKNQYPFLVKFALWIGANPNVKEIENGSGDSLLHILIDSKDQERSKEIANILVKKNINTRAFNYHKGIALKYAVHKSNLMMLNFLLDKQPPIKDLMEILRELAYSRRQNQTTLSEEDKNIISHIAKTLKAKYKGQDKTTLRKFIQYMNKILPILEAPKGEKLEASQCPMLSIINGILKEKTEGESIADSDNKNIPTVSQQQSKVSHSKQLRINTSDSNTSSKNNSPSNSPKQSQRRISNTISPSSTTSSSSWSSRSSRESSPSSSRGK